MLRSQNSPCPDFIRTEIGANDCFRCTVLIPIWVLEVIINNTHESASSAIGWMKQNDKEEWVCFLFFLFLREY